MFSLLTLKSPFRCFVVVVVVVVVVVESVCVCVCVSQLCIGANRTEINRTNNTFRDPSLFLLCFTLTRLHFVICPFIAF